MITILIDNAYGLDTKGRMSPFIENLEGIPLNFLNGNRFCEWVFNRELAKSILVELQHQGFTTRLVVNERVDINLASRVKRINNICSQYGAKNVVLLSIGCGLDLNKDNWSDKKGWSFYVTDKRFENDLLGSCMMSHAIKYLGDSNVVKNNPYDMQECDHKGFLLKKVLCPSVATQNFFYTNESNLRYMVSEEGYQNLIKVHVDAVVDYAKSLKETKQDTLPLFSLV